MKNAQQSSALVSLLTAALCLAGCGGNSNDGTTTSTAGMPSSGTGSTSGSGGTSGSGSTGSGSTSRNWLNWHRSGPVRARGGTGGRVAQEPGQQRDRWHRHRHRLRRHHHSSSRLPDHHNPTRPPNRGGRPTRAIQRGRHRRDRLPVVEKRHRHQRRNQRHLLHTRARRRRRRRLLHSRRLEHRGFASDLEKRDGEPQPVNTDGSPPAAFWGNTASLPAATNVMTLSIVNATNGALLRIARSSGASRERPAPVCRSTRRTPSPRLQPTTCRPFSPPACISISPRT